jgi:hypothetical protein
MKKNFLFLTLMIFTSFAFNQNASAFGKNKSNNKSIKQEKKISKPQFINSKSRVLLIGDSHTAGYYGKEMDGFLRKTKAKVETFGSSGSIPSWWIDGTETTFGFYSKDQNNKVYENINWKTPHKTPILEEELESFKPNIVIVSLGANLIRKKADFIQSEVKSICEIISKHKSVIIWVGPPNGRPDKKKPEEQAFLYDNIKPVVLEYNGYFIDSRPYTKYPESGKDGIHFFGKEGKLISRFWAKKIMDQIQLIK